MSERPTGTFYEKVTIHPTYNQLNNIEYEVRTVNSKAKVMPWLTKLSEVEALISGGTPIVADVFSALTSFNNTLHKVRVGTFEERYDRQILTEEKTEELLNLIAIPSITSITVTGVKEGDKFKEGKAISLTYTIAPAIHTDLVCVSSNPNVADVTSTGELMCRRPGFTTLTFYHVFDPSKRVEMRIEVINKNVLQRII